MLQYVVICRNRQVDRVVFTIKFLHQIILGDTSLLPLKEWKGLNGELGVYHSQAHDYYYLFILIPSEDKHYTLSYPPTDRDKVIHLAEFIAAFAGAQEILP